MRIRTIIQRIVLVIVTILIFSSLALADVIYLKDGTILIGNIIQETTETITIQGEGYETTVNRADIQRIVREIQKPQ